MHNRYQFGACSVMYGCCLFLLQQFQTASGQGGGGGFWEGPYELPIIPASVANLPDGKLLMWSAYDLLDSNRRGNGQTWTAIWDPSQPANKPEGVLVKTTGHDMFCPGTAYLPDGRIVITGGSNSGRVTIYDNGVWRRGEDMKLSRGYHSSTVTVDGGIFTMGGSWHEKKAQDDVDPFTWAFRYQLFKWLFDFLFPWPRKDGEVWDPQTEKWTLKKGVKCEGSMVTNDILGQYRNDNHMWLFTAPNGKLFHAGPSKMTHYIALNGEGSIQEKLRRGTNDTMMGNAVMFDIGKILTLGGSPDYEFLPATSEAHVITLDPNGSDDVSIQRVQDLRYPRAMVNSVVLPNGKVVVVGGMIQSFTNLLEGSVLEAEMFDPVTNTFTPLASMSVERNYHSSAILLKDGRVFAGGGGQCVPPRGCAANVNKFDCEVFTPPYLVHPVTNALITDRPVIISAPASAVPGDSIVVQTQSEVTSFALVRLGAATHSTNLDSRRIPLYPTLTVGTTYTLPLPRAAICLPGTYFLFVMDAAGVPSVAETISIRP